uniref:hypothetical chloroplast RF1 n=1 Tax=Chrysosplenium echinus TaxID=78265 RepID=UPI0021D532BA|nr:hypothetical chloroplast RF1 [Chrysosplenium echinus]UXE34039.1 hypothetical chloroplast RF1 [Chrysosplenium echinus]
MILKSFLLGNLLSLCMKIINSVVVVGLYYGFLTTFSIGPSYLFLLRAQVMEEGTQKKVSATTGFITGQLMMFISIYYAPLHLALGRPHTITVLALPYLLFHFFWNNHKHFLDYGSTTRNSMRNLSIQCVFLNNLIFQLFNYFILPSSMLARLVNIYMFRCNNKMLFVTSSFVGWLIGHILFMKWVGLVLVWIRQNHSIRSNVLIRSNKYLVSEVRNSMARIFSILLFITCVYYLGRIPSPSVTKKLKETSETEERGESEEETDVEIEPTSKTKGTKEEQEGSTEEDPSPSLFSEEKEDPDKIDETEEIRVNGTEKTKDEFHFHFKETFYKNSRVYETSDLDGNHENSKLEILKNKEDPFFWFEKLLVIGLFDYKRWTRPLPLRYIKNERFENAVRNEMSQYFFYTCRSDGKQKISFMYTPSLSTFLEMIQRKMALYTTENPSSYELDNQWVYTNEQNENKLSNEFISRIEAIDKGSLPLDVVLEKKTRLCNDETKKEYLPKKYDPFSNGPYRGIIHFVFSPSIINKIPIGNSIGTLWINKIHEILIATSYREFDKRIAAFDRKSISTEIRNGNLLNFISEFAVKSICSIKILKQRINTRFSFSEQEKNYSQAKLLFNAVITDTNEYKIRNKDLEIEIKEISKKIPRWSYKLIDELEQQEKQNEEDAEEDHQIRSRKAKRVVIFTNNQQNPDTYTTTLDTNNSDQTDEVALIHYSQQSDFRRDIIKGSMRAQRRKITILELFQANVHSPFFFNRMGNPPLFLFDISELIKFIFINKMGENTEFKISDYVEEDTNEQEKKEADKRATDRLEDQARIEIAEAWDSIIFAQIIRGSILVTQSILRRYIILPSLIIAKNMGRMLLFQFPEWSEDLKGWKREMHVKCTYNGVQLSETEFPKNWLIDGIQIKILFPFRLKPWHRSKLASPFLIKKKDKKNDDFCFLTVLGMEAELPFGSPRKRSSFFDSIFKKLRKKILKWKTNCFIVLIERTNFVLIISKEIKTWIIKNIIFIQRIIKELLKINPTLFLGLKEISGLNETKKDKDSRISNNMIYESSSQIKSLDWTNYSLAETKIKDLTDRTNRIRTQIGKILKDKKNKKGNDAERFESPKTFEPMFQRRNIRLIRKSIFFIKFFFKKIYIYIFLFIINILQINTPLFLESKKKYMGKYIFNIKVNQEVIDKTNQNTINFRKSLSNLSKNSLSKNSQNLSSLSQAYVFYKLSQIQVNNLDKLRFVLQYNGTSLFLTNEIKDDFEAQGILHSEFQNKKFGINQWKTRLRGHYQYNLSKIRWSKLVPGKWRNRVNQTQNKDLNKRDSYEKDQVIYYKLPNQKDYGYDLLSYQSISYEDTKNSSIYVSPLQVNNNQGISCNYNTRKYKLFDGIGDILSNNYLVKNGIVDMDKNPDRKYGDWKMIHFCLRNTVDIETWINTNSHKKTKTINGKKIEKKGLMIHQQIKPSNKKRFDWMGMNEQIRNRPISNLKLWFFPEFALLYNSYKMKPWFIPIKLLFNGDVNISATKNINQNPKKDLSSNKTNYLELENGKKKEKESPTRGNPRSDAQNRRNRGSVQEEDLDENYGVGSDIKKRRKKKEYQSNTEAELHLFLKRYLLFQLRWDDSLNQRMLNNIKVYCFLLRLLNPREIAISSIQRGEMSLGIMLIQKDLTLTELMRKSLFIIEPVRLSVTRDGKFFMYQTISISFVHKSKDKANQGNQEKRYVDKPIAKHQKITENQNKNHYVLPVPENILSLRRRREFRIRICLDSRNGNGCDRNTVFCDEKNCDQFLDKSTNLEIEKNKLIKLFLWPTYQLEDLACMNRYWFDTTNGSHFNMVRINMYPRG